MFLDFLVLFQSTSFLFIDFSSKATKPRNLQTQQKSEPETEEEEKSLPGTSDPSFPIFLNKGLDFKSFFSPLKTIQQLQRDAREVVGKRRSL